MLDNAKALVSSGMAQEGYRYVVVDGCWEAPSRDSSGALQGDPATFPDGMAQLVICGHVHSTQSAREYRVMARSLLPQVAIVTLVVWQGLTLVRATTIYGRGHALSDARYLSIALPLVAAAAILTTARVSDWWWRLLIVGFAVGAVATIRASPRPSIDVWYLVQHASDCVLRGCDPYTLNTPQAPGLQRGFPYLPVTAVLLAPFRLLLHDVRYGEALAVVVAAVLLRRCGTRTHRG